MPKKTKRNYRKSLKKQAKKKKYNTKYRKNRKYKKSKQRKITRGGS